MTRRSLSNPSTTAPARQVKRDEPTGATLGSMQRAATDRLAVLLVAMASLSVLWYGSGALETLALSQSTRSQGVAGNFSAHRAGDYARTFDYAVAPQRTSAGAFSPRAVDQTLPSRWSME